MEKLIDWCTQHIDDPPPPPVIEGEEDLAMFNEEIGEWDKEFLKMDDSVLFDLILVCPVFCKSVSLLQQAVTVCYYGEKI